MTSYRTGEVVLVRFPFADLSSSKRRPGLVLATAKLHSDLVIVAMVTSQVDGPILSGDLLLRDWQAAGLLHASKVRVAKMATLEAGLLERRLGRLSKRDARAVAAAFKALFRPLLAP